MRILLVITCLLDYHVIIKVKESIFKATILIPVLFVSWLSIFTHQFLISSIKHFSSEVSMPCLGEYI